MRLIVLNFTCFLALVSARISHSEDLFRVYDLEFEGELGGYHVEDLNNDGMKDILMLLTRGRGNSAQRWLSLFLQTDAGYAPRATQTFQVSDRILVMDCGNVAGGFEKELVYFEGGGIYYLNLADSGFVLSPQNLFETESIFMLTARGAPKKWDFVADLNGDNIDEVMVPRVAGTDVYFRSAAGDGWVKNETPLTAEARFRASYSKRFSVGHRAEATYSTPYIAREDFNSDGRKDLLGVYQDSLLVVCQDQRGQFLNGCRHVVKLDFGEIWRGQKIQRTRIGDKSERTFLKRITDLNGDGLLDVVSIVVSTRKSILSPSSEVRIHFGKRDATNSSKSIFFAAAPDQVLTPGGTLLVFDIVDLNHDGKLDLVIPTVKVGLKNLISMMLTKTVEIQAETYLMNETGRYSEEPDLRPKMVVGFSYRGGTTSPVYEIEDFNGDGHLDILSSQQERRLVIFWGNTDKIFESSVGAKYSVLLPQNGEMAMAVHLNSDNKSDLVIRYDEDNARHREFSQTLRVLIAN